MTGKRSAGFSLFEMLLVIALIGVITTATMPIAELMFIKTKEAELEGNLAAIRQAISLYKRDCRNAIVRQLQKGYTGLYRIPDSDLCPPSLMVLWKPEKHDIVDPDILPLGTGLVSFYPKPYLNSIPIDPFVGAAAWTIDYASGTNTSIFEGGAIVPPLPTDHVGIFDVSCVDNTGNRRRGFVQAIDGTNYTDW